MISPAAHGPSAAGQSAMRRPSAARGPGCGGRLLNQLSSVCQLCVGTYRFARDYGCVHPGMPPDRKHLRRIRGAPTVETRNGAMRPCGWSKNYFHVRREVAGSQLAIGCRMGTEGSPVAVRADSALTRSSTLLGQANPGCFLLRTRAANFPHRACQCGIQIEAVTSNP